MRYCDYYTRVGTLHSYTATTVMDGEVEVLLLGLLDFVDELSINKPNIFYLC